jgi:hypothetical protein
MPHDQTCWLDEALNLVPKDLPADEVTTHREILESYLRPLLRRCRATTKPRFWIWLRCQLAKSEDLCHYLTWMRESQCPQERRPVNWELSSDQRIALVDVGSDGHPAILKLPAEKLEWFLSIQPLILKKLPALEAEELKQIRALKMQLKNSPFLTSDWRRELVKEITELEKQVERRSYDPAPRYSLVKREWDGTEIPAHRLFLGCSPEDIVQPWDGDFLNWTWLTVKITVAPPVVTDDFLIGKGCRPPVVEQEEYEISNLAIVNSNGVQKDFEKSHLQFKKTLQGDIKTTLRVQPNASWKAGVCGHVADCGSSAPVTSEEARIAGLAGAEVRPADEVSTLSRKWRVPRGVSGLRWG